MFRQSNWKLVKNLIEISLIFRGNWLPAVMKFHLFPPFLQDIKVILHRY